MKPRDLVLDFMRGYLLFVIVVDHLRDATFLVPFTGDIRLWVSAAEGFVLLSGFLVGRLRGDEARAGGLDLVTRKLLGRAARIALWTVIVSDLLLAIVWLTGYFPGAIDSVRGDTLSFGWKVGLGQVLLYIYGDHNILAAYALYLALSPLMLRALLAGRPLLVVVPSLALWVAGGITPSPLRLTDCSQADLSWQLLWVIGVVAGFHHQALAARWRPRWSIAVAALTVVTLALAWWRWPTDAPGRLRLEHILFAHARLGPARVALAILWSGAAYLLLRRFQPLFMRALGWLLVPLGQNSLYVFLVHGLLLFPLVGHPTGDPWQGTARALAVVLVLWMLVKKRVLFGIIPR